MRVNRHLAAGLVTAAAVALVAAPLQSALATPASSSVDQQFGSYEKMTPENREALLTAADRPTISIFSNQACSACQAWAASLKKMAEGSNNKWRFVYIDTDVNQGIQERLGVFELTDLIGTYKGNFIQTPYRPTHGEFVNQWIDYFLKKTAMNDLPFRAIPATKPDAPYAVTKQPFPPMPGKPAKSPLPMWNDTDPRPAGVPAPGTPMEGTVPGDQEHPWRVITDKNYDQLLEDSKKKLVILDFSKDDCAPCKDLEKILVPKIAADKNDWIWGMMDGTQYPAIWEKYHKPWFPSMIAIRDGKEVVRRTGYEGDSESVIKWLDTLRKGEVPEQELMVMDATTDADIAKIDSISARHPMALRFHNDAVDTKSKENGFYAANLANSDGGKWTLVNIDRTSEWGKALAKKLNIDIAQNAMVVYYNKAVRLEPLKGIPDNFDMRDWISTMLSTKYPENKPTPVPTGSPSSR